MITGRWETSGVAVEVSPSGALTAISLTPQAIRLGPDGLSTAILDAVARASACAESTTPQRWSLP
jgi:hypothetical protein